MPRARDRASMRPPEFTGGNIKHFYYLNKIQSRFNEAAGIHRRKRRPSGRKQRTTARRFNEAAGIHRRKQMPSICAT